MSTTVVSETQIREWLAEVPDPEIPVLSITDLGIVRDVSVADEISVSIAPTYSGCPATEVIESSVRQKLRSKGLQNVAVRRVLSPPWTTDWISESGKQKMRTYGIAPPQKNDSVACPQCESTRTELISQFGSTACKASWRCCDCREPFEYFKCL